MAELEDAVRRTLHQRRAGLLEMPNVVATGLGYKVTDGRRTDDLCIACSVAQKIPLSSLAESERLPAQVDGVPTDVVETGPLRALQHTGRHRPAPGGVSLGHHAITAGTLGCLVQRDGVRLILSNNHVLANSNDASPGDAIYQPGPHDGGTAADRIGVLEDFVPILFPGEPSQCTLGQGAARLANSLASLLGSSTRLQAVRPQQAEDNLVDAAVARPDEDDLVVDEILEIGSIAGVAEAGLGTTVRKSGRTTGLTQGEITQVDVTASVSYGSGKVARFTDQLMAGAISQGGDSGSAVLDEERNLVGLLFAGSDSTTIINRIQNVFELLRLSR